MTSLPLPLSPVMRIEASLGATWSARPITASIAGSSKIIWWLSSATAARTAAISSGSGGSGRYSLAPARMASTALRASVPMPQATTGVQMRSAESPRTSCPMSHLTSQSTRSAPSPPRRLASACSMSTAWVTRAPRSIAILVAAVSWPCSCPTIRSLMVLSSRRQLRLTRLDDFGHGDAEPILDQNDLAACDQAVVDVDVDRLADLAVELDDSALAELQELADFHRRLAEHGGHRDGHVEHRFQILGGVPDLDIGRRRAGQQCGAVARIVVGQIGQVDIVGHGLFLRRMREATRDQFADRGFDVGCGAFGAAAAPFDAAVGGRHLRLARDDDAALEALFVGD